MVILSGLFPNSSSKDEKLCSQCKRTFPVSHYRVDSRKPKGLASYCRACANGYKQRARSKRQPKVIPASKFCRWCEQTKHSDFFPLLATSSDGLSHKCSQCWRNYRANRGEVEHGNVRTKRRSGQGSDPLPSKPLRREKFTEEQRRQRHREANRASRLRCAEENPDRERKLRQEYYLKNRERLSADNKRWRDNNKDKMRRLLIAGKHRRRARELAAEGKFVESDILMLFQAQNARCAYCITPLDAGYHVDHKMPLSRGGSNWPDNLCVACPTCNLRKHDKTAEEFAVLLVLEQSLIAMKG